MLQVTKDSWKPRGARGRSKRCQCADGEQVWAVGESPTCERSPGPARHLNDGIWDTETTRDGEDKTSPNHERGEARAGTNRARDGGEVKQRKVI